jgi:hypothetical protein
MLTYEHCKRSCAQLKRKNDKAVGFNFLVLLLHIQQSHDCKI